MVEAKTSFLGLNLNVVVPAGTSPDAKLPIMVVRLFLVLSTSVTDTNVGRTSSSSEVGVGRCYARLSISH